MMTHGEIPHALLLAGPRGTGKTSAARILSAMVNDPANSHTPGGEKKSLHEPNLENDIVKRIYTGNSLVVTEIDAASYRGIDDIRQLRERVNLPPQEGSTSVYILDEVHMLTTEAFNALLKMLEEPPEHVLFILATTELHKIPDTITSRATIIHFTRANDGELLAALSHILLEEKIKFDEEAVRLVVQSADGSFRDGVKLLESVAAGQKKIDLLRVQEILHTTKKQSIVQVLDAIVAKDDSLVVQVFQTLRAEDADEAFFYKALLQFLHEDLVASITEKTPAHFSAKVSHFLLQHFSTVPLSSTVSIPFLALELKSLELIFKSKEKNGEGKSKPPVAPPSTSEMQTSKNKKSDVIEIAAYTEKLLDVVMTPSPLVESFTQSESNSWADGKKLIERWEDFLSSVRLRNSSIEALLRSSKPISGEGGKAKIEVYYRFHQDQLQQPKFVQMIEECIVAVLGGKIVLEFTLAQQSERGALLSSVTGNVNENDSLIQLAKEIFV